MIDASCDTIFAPSKGRHLIFDLGRSDNVRGFEPTSSEGDLWYQTVKRLVSSPAVLGREMDPESFVNSFPQVALMKCALPRSKIVTVLRKEQGAISTEFVPIFGDGTNRDFYCATPNKSYIALFSYPGDRQPYSIPVSGDLVRFDKSYGDISLTRTEVHLSKLFPSKLRHP
jgi:hypothetical protein